MNLLVSSSLRQRGHCNYTNKLMKACRTEIFFRFCCLQKHVRVKRLALCSELQVAPMILSPQILWTLLRSKELLQAGRVCFAWMWNCDTVPWKKWKTSQLHIKYLSPILVFPPFTRWKIGSHTEWLAFCRFYLQIFKKKFRFEAHTLKWIWRTHARRPSGFGCCL